MSDIQLPLAEAFLAAIEPNKTVNHFFVAVLKDEGGKRISSKEIRGTIEETKDRLVKYNKEGYEIFVLINRLKDGAGRKNENITHARACFVDSDTGSIDNFVMKPNIIVQSSRGEHAYYLIEPTQDLKKFTECQKGLISVLKTDPVIKDPARCMRLPGFFSHTNKSSPVLVTIKHLDKRRQKIEEIIDLHPVNESEIGKLKKFSNEEKSDSSPPVKLLTDEYVQFGQLRDGFVYYCGVMHQYTGTHYKPVLEAELKPSILRFLQNHHEKYATASMANNIFTQLTARGLVSSDFTTPCFLNDFSKPKVIIPMKNGLFCLDDYMKQKNCFFIPHSKDYFSLTCLPYSYDPEAKCPEFMRFLKRIQPQKDVRLLLQEWCGYNLIHKTNLEKMMLFVGAGANGKTVLCTIMKELLGNENVSAVPLEQFSPSKPYQLTEAVGMLANIHEEFSGGSQISEGILKQFITGSSMTFERKMQRPFKARPTARLTFCSNELPQFKDRSSGLWRRLICVPFSVQIPAAEQRTEYQDGPWWIETGEMKGIFNWALRGLVRLLNRGHFKEPESCKLFKKQYREDVNPTKTFLDKHCAIGKGEEIGTTELYSAYREFMSNVGEQKLSMAQFAEEVRRIFKVNKSSNAVKRNGRRERIWINLSFNP